MIFSIGKATIGLEKRSYCNDSKGNSKQKLHIPVQRIIQRMQEEQLLKC